MRRTGARGLTLIEVVAAVALLSALTVAILPLLVDATKSITPRAAGIDPTALRVFSETWLADETSLARLHPGDGTRVVWDVDGERRAVDITRLYGTDNETIPHDWIRFKCGDVRLLRFLLRSDPATTPQTGAPQ